VKARVDVALAEAAGQADAAVAAARAKSHEADRLSPEALKEAGWWKWLLLMVDAARQVIRPVATVMLTWAALSLTDELIAGLRAQGIEPAHRLELGRMAINWLFSQASATLSYWFVSRGAGK
jgi:hypothetical protein